ncbi:MAG: DUF6777 domain-containing protein [Acidimicrobiales bacterium]
MAPTPAPTGGGGDGGHGGVVALILVLVGLLIVVSTVVYSSREGGDEGAAGEVYLEAASATGTNPFTEPVDPTPSTTAAPAPPATAGSPPSVVPVTQPTSGVAPPPGSPPYGGSGDDRVCNREQLITFLTTYPDRGAAFAGVLGIAVADLPTYVRSLRPTVLLYDTRVTNHGFANGRATTLQSILQAGTAVLVDAAGNPVVRCRCGNPLTPPAPVARPVLRGTPWPGFSPTIAVAVDNGVTVTVVINVVQAPGAPSPSATSSSTSSVPAGSSTSVSSPAGTAGGGADEVRARVEALLRGCGLDATVLDTQQDLELLGVSTVRARVDGTEMLFTYTSATGTLGEGDRASADIVARCGFG